MSDTPEPPQPIPAAPLHLNAAVVRRPDGVQAIQLTFTLLMEAAQAAQLGELVKQLAVVAATGLQIASPAPPVPPMGNGGLRIIKP